MTRNNIIKQLVYLCLPAIIFYLCYARLGILNATMLAGVFSLSINGYHLIKYKKITRTQLLGLIGLALSFIAVYFTDNAKYYYLPALINNCILAGFAAILTLRGKSVFHYVIKDFNLPLIQHTCESDFLRLNALWIAFFIIKIISKAAGIFFLSFTQLYWLVFLLGDPMTILLVVYSFYFIRKNIRKKER